MPAISTSRAAAILALLGAVACSRAPERDAPPAGPPPVTPGEAVAHVTTLGITGATNAAASLAASGSQVVVVWAATVGDATNIYAAASADGGATFAAPVRVNDTEGDARLSGDQGPRVTIGREILVAWESKLTGTSRIRLARSSDNGRTFKAAETLHAEALPGARGWASVAADSTGLVQAAWLDGRNANHDAPMAHDHAAMAAGHDHAMEQDLFHLTTRPDGTRVEALIARNVCFCCKTGVAGGFDGAMYVAWRHVYPTNFRDIAVAHSTDEGRTWSAPVRVSEDHWQIDACPEDGPSIAVGDHGVVHLVWPTTLAPAFERKAIFYSFSTDGGKTFAARIRLDEGDATVRVAAHPQLVVSAGRVVVTWDEDTASGRRIRLREIDTTGQAPMPAATVAVVSAADGPARPAVAVSGDAVALAWSVRLASGSMIRVQTVPSPAPKTR